jgi:REP-associated tyrosine transposase
LNNRLKAKSFLRKTLDHTAHFSARFGATYFLTICCAEKGRNQLCKNKVRDSIFMTAKMHDARGAWHLELLLLMPDHLHALIAIDGEASLSSIVASFKRATSRLAKVRWQRNFFDHRLRHDESFDEKETYIRQNPVRTGLINNEDDWPYVLDRSEIDMAGR